MGLEDFIGITAICGDEGSCKTTMALSYPRPLFHLDTDVGGFRRAIWRFKKDIPDLRVKDCEDSEDISKLNFAKFDIVSKPYPKPIQMQKLVGQLTSSPDIRQIKFPKKVEGMKELWQEIVTDFVIACQSPVATIIIDSSTSLWNTAHNARLQELQEIQEYKWAGEHKGTPFNENEYRERLQPIEYGPANDRMRTLFHTARAFRKNLVLTHYPTDEYGTIPDGKGGMVEGKTGTKIIDGFKETKKLADLVVWLRIKETVGKGNVKTRQPIARIEKSGIEGMGLDAVGMEVDATFEGVINLRNLMRG